MYPKKEGCYREIVEYMVSELVKNNRMKINSGIGHEWNVHAILDQIIVNSSNSAFIPLDRAFFDYYLHKTGRLHNKDYNELRKKLVELERVSEETLSIDMVLATTIYAVIICEYDRDTTQAKEAIGMIEASNFFLEIHSKSGPVNIPSLGFVLGLIASVHEKYRKELPNKCSSEMELMETNYYLALQIENKKLGLQNGEEIKAKKVANFIVNQGNLNPILKIPSLAFCTAPEEHFEQVVGSLLKPDAYVFLFGYNTEETRNGYYLGIEPQNIVKFLFVSNILGWQHLKSVSPAFLKQLKKLSTLANPIAKDYSSYIIEIISFSLGGFALGLSSLAIYYNPQAMWKILLELGGVISLLSVPISFYRHVWKKHKVVKLND